MVEQRMERPTALIVCVSEHHGNTHRVANAMAKVLGADVVEPEIVDLDELRRFDLVGFGSGIYFGVVHPRLGELIDRLPPGDGQSVFTFSTSGMFLLPWLGTADIRHGLGGRHYEVLGDFNCRGLDTVGPLRFIGGVNRGHPDASDLERATAFAHDMRHRAKSQPRTRARIGGSRQP
jgi:flavodoxin